MIFVNSFAATHLASRMVFSDILRIVGTYARIEPFFLDAQYDRHD